MSRNLADTLLDARLHDLQQKGHLRSRLDDVRATAESYATALGRPLLDLSSNDYLGFARRPLHASAVPGGAGASRLIHGTRDAHREAESTLARFARQDSALLFSSGYAANVGLVSALAQPGDVVISDALNHASLIDGCRLSKAQVRTFPHRDLCSVARFLEEAQGQNTWVLTESYFSMDGTIPDLAALDRLVRSTPNSYLVVDEAHALGAFGPKGAGLCAQAGVLPTAMVGTFGKSIGLQGAFVAGSASLCDWVWNRARSFVYSTAPSPALAAEVPRRVAELEAADSLRTQLHHLCTLFHVKLRSALPKRYSAETSHGPIVPLQVGDEHTALEARDALARRGILTQAIRPPTVPAGSSRLRLSLHAELTPGDLDYVLEQLIDVLHPEGTAS